MKGSVIGAGVSDIMILSVPTYHVVSYSDSLTSRAPLCWQALLSVGKAEDEDHWAGGTGGHL